MNLSTISRISAISWRMTQNEVPLRVFLSTFAIRVIFQALFFVWIAHVIGGPVWMKFALYGNVLLPAIQFLFVDVYNVMREEIDEQRIDLLFISKTHLLTIVLGRTIVYVLKTFLIMCFTYAIVGGLVLSGYEHWVFFLKSIPILLVLCLASYSLSIFISSFHLSDRISQFLPNLAVMLLMLLGDFTIPVHVLPGPLQDISMILPLHHGVDAFRDYMVNHRPYLTNPNFYWELLILVIYTFIGYAVYLSSIRKHRRQPV